MELKGFAKVTLSPGQRETVTLSLPATQLQFLDADLKSTFEPGEVEILVGPSADRARLLAQTVVLRA
jgi:beta-glucosidase